MGQALFGLIRIGSRKVEEENNNRQGLEPMIGTLSREEDSSSNSKSLRRVS